MKSKKLWLLSVGASLQLLTMNVCAFTEASEKNSEPATHISGDTSLRSSTTDDSYEKSRVFGLNANLSATHLLEEDLNVKLAAGLLMESGSSQGFFYNEYKPQHSLYLSEATLNWGLFSGAALQVGAINQEFHDSPLLFTSTAIPAVREIWKSATAPFQIELSAEQAIPGTDTSSNLNAPADATPLYDIERLQLSYERKNTKIELRASHFAFRNLPSNVANESRFRGNSVAGIGDSGAQYLYLFDGIESGARLRFNEIAGFDTLLGADFILNTAAPSPQNQALRLFVESRFSLGHKIQLTPSISLFRNESDATPGFYNTASLAHSNRQGMSVGARVEIPSSSLKIEGQFIKADVIQPSPFQSDFTGFFLTLRKSYELL